MLNAAVGSDSVFTVNLSHTFNIFDDESTDNLPFVNGATVKLYEDGNFLFDLTGTDNGYYRHEGFYPQKGKEYTVTATYKGYEKIEASTIIPSEVPIISFDTSATFDYYEYGYDLKVHAVIKYKDPPGVRNFYVLSCRAYGMMFEETYGWYNQDLWVPETSKMLFDNDYGDILWNDEYTDGKEVTLDVGFLYWYMDELSTNETDTTRFVFYFKNITEDYYTYLKSVNIYYETGGADNPFVEPVVIFSNVENGYGILGGYGEDTARFDFIYDIGWKKGGAK